MKETWLRRTAWIIAMGELAILLVSAILVILNPVGQDARFSELLSGAIIACGAPILGLVILRQQPHNRIGWLWLFYALAASFFSLAWAIKYFANSSSPIGYSMPVFVMLLLTEMANILKSICLILLILWFPDGQPPSPRWRFLHWWTAIAFILWNAQLFKERINWTTTNGVIGGPGNVNNPLGIFPDRFAPVLDTFTAIGFFSLVLALFLATLSIIVRYRSSGQQVRAQISWFLVGSAFSTITGLASIFLMNYLGNLTGVLANLIILPLYIGVGIAITRYRLYDIHVIIRRTLIYGALTATLAIVFFGGVALLQNAFSSLTGTESSPVAIVISTLAIVALFSPLRRWLQGFIDRRFYRRKYDAQQILEQFALTARNETDLDALTAELVRVAQETMQPDGVSLWLSSVRRPSQLEAGLARPPLQNAIIDR